MRIFLTGFMGSGKSTYAKKLSLISQLTFIDLDKRIEEKAGMSIADIFKNNGEDYFRRLEKQLLTEIIKEDDFVMATGGGTAAFEGNMKMMNKSGITVFLKVEIAELVKRLEKWTQKDTKRPLLAEVENLHIYVTKLLQKRNCYYRQAHYIISPRHLQPEMFWSIILSQEKTNNSEIP